MSDQGWIFDGAARPNTRERRLCLSLFAGLGGGALGFARAGYETVGVELWDAACRDYTTLTGHECVRLDLATCTPDDLRAVTGGRTPDVVLTSPPCQAFSGCLPLAKAGTAKYQELSSLAERGVWLALEAWDEPPRLLLLENVPRIQSRGRQWLDGMASLLAAYGYGWRETTHDCAELGGLAQRRRRFLGVARHHRSTPDLLYQPPLQEPRGVGDVLGALPVPGPWAGGAGGPMHTLPRLSALNWLRLACIPAGADWRALPDRVRLVVGDVDPRSTCERRAGSLGVTAWGQQTHAVIGAASIQNTALQVADPRLTCSPRSGAYGVAGWGETGCTVVASACHDNGAYTTADPRLKPRAARQNGGYGVNAWDDPSHAVIATANVGVSWSSVSDPRGWPAPTHELRVGDDGVLELHGPAIDITSRAPTTLVIRALDGTWHRPLTTLELAALQSLPTQIDGEWLVLDGRSHKDWRKRIGNAIPAAAAEAIARQMTLTLDASDDGVLTQGATPRWVGPQIEEGVYGR